MLTKAGEGIERNNCKCLAPLFRQDSLFVGNGTFISAPFSNGLHEITFIFKC